MRYNQPHRPPRRYPLLGSLAAIAILASCGGGVKDPAADDPAFEGLSPAIIQEVLNTPYSRANLQPEQYDIQDAYNQEIAWFGYLFQVCRDYLDVYEQWTRTGQAPAAPTPPQIDWEGPKFTMADEARAALESGEARQLLKTLAGANSSCNWVPVVPGSPQTIRQLLYEQYLLDLPGDNPISAS